MTDAELDNWTLADEEPFTPPAPALTLVTAVEELVITDAQTANLLLREMLQIEMDIAEIRTKRTEALVAVTAPFDAQLLAAENRAQTLTATYKPALEAWYRSTTGTDGSMKLQFGTLKYLTVRGGALEVKDEKKLMAWCAVHLPTAIKVTKSLLKDPVKALLADESPDALKPPAELYSLTPSTTRFDISLGYTEGK